MKKAYFMGAVFFLVIAPGLPDMALARQEIIAAASEDRNGPLMNRPLPELQQPPPSPPPDPFWYLGGGASWASMVDAANAANVAHAVAADQCDKVEMVRQLRRLEGLDSEASSRTKREKGYVATDAAREIRLFLEAARQRQAWNCPTAQGAQSAGGVTPPAGNVTSEGLDVMTRTDIDAKSNDVKPGELTPDRQNKNQTTGTTPDVPTANPQRRPIRWYELGSIRGGAGTGSVPDWTATNCAEIIKNLDATSCSGKDGGPTFAVEGALLWDATSRRFYFFEISANVTNPSPTKKGFAGQVFDAGDKMWSGSGSLAVPSSHKTSKINAIGEMWSGTGSLALWLFGLDGVLGVRLNDRVSISAGGGARYFKAKQKGTFTFLGQTDRNEQQFSGLGPSARAGIEVGITRYISLSAETSWTWMSDASDSPEQAAWSEKFRMWTVGMKVFPGGRVPRR